MKVTLPALLSGFSRLSPLFGTRHAPLLQSKWGSGLSFVLVVLWLLTLPQPTHGQTLTSEVQDRRERLAQRLPDGLIILPARWDLKTMEQPSWIQEPAFAYFTSLTSAPGAILLIDSPAERSVLFSGPTPESFGLPIPDLNLQNRDDWAAQSGVSAVLPQAAFETYVQSRMREGVSKIYLDRPRRELPSEVPTGMLQVSGFHRLWEQSLSHAFPGAQFLSASQAIDDLTWTKSPREIEQLRINAAYSAKALIAGMHAIREGATQRQAEGHVVSGCLEAGAEGPSFWPWVMTGRNAQLQRVVKSFYDYSHLNTTFQAGELVRVDVGCMAGGYGGDVGRTVPVSGRFSKDQEVVWDALVAGYLAGIEAMKAGKTLPHIFEASRAGIRAWGDAHPGNEEIVRAMASDTGVDWHIHGVGIESAEPVGTQLEEGSVIAFEPMYSDQNDAYYLEDMILITRTGAEILTTGLPYRAFEMHTFLSHAH